MTLITCKVVIYSCHLGIKGGMNQLDSTRNHDSDILLMVVNVHIFEFPGNLNIL